MLMNGQFISKIVSCWANLVKGYDSHRSQIPQKLPYKYVQQIQAKQKNAAVQKELLSTIEGIYTQFSKLCVHNMLWTVNQPVFTIVYLDDLKLN